MSSNDTAGGGVFASVISFTPDQKAKSVFFAFSMKTLNRSQRSFRAESRPSCVRTGRKSFGRSTSVSWSFELGTFCLGSVVVTFGFASHNLADSEGGNVGLVCRGGSVKHRVFSVPARASASAPSFPVSIDEAIEKPDNVEPDMEISCPGQLSLQPLTYGVRKRCYCITFLTSSSAWSSHTLIARKKTRV
ncbi:hypothetical protein ARMSODRAFT_1022554 [Armillaria solidipes]|uniref:Uncharacterized protein n=1 Tax=Armillaria solidipes TaxID=1076256 RepID=A0A2H3B2N0_9AGAR|nr:hypothetical protein ARMSODRAFT_1022554 [Armillaria solidipes]